MSHSDRSRKWSAEEGAPRFWWHRLPGMNYVPAIYSDLSESEWAIVAEWFEETSRAGQVDEVSVPLMSALHGFVLGNRAERIVQLGTHAGYFALLLGFMLRRMNARRGLFAIDNDPGSLAATRQWIGRAQLDDFVEVAGGDFLQPGIAEAAKGYLGTAPELIILDDSREFSSTLRQLDLWYGALAYGGMLVVHDVSRFAENFDPTKEGGVRRAFVEWRAAHPECESILLNPNAQSTDAPLPFYKDARGLGLIHKPRAQ